MHNSNLYHQQSGIALNGCSSSVMAALYLYYYEKNFTNSNSIHLYKYTDLNNINRHNNFNQQF